MSKYRTKENDVYRFKVDDGWLQIDKYVFEKMIDYVEKEEYKCLETFFEKEGYNLNRISRIVPKESMATKMSEEMAILVHTESECFALSKYSKYYVVDHMGKAEELE